MVRPLLFRIDPEAAHNLAIRFLAAMGDSALISAIADPAPPDPALRQRLWGLDFPNPVGMAAGFDKNAECVPALERLGFGFVEVGTITPRPQPGNEGVRLYRLPLDEALINRLGFNSRGADAAAASLARLTARRRPLGVNLGRNKATPNERAAEDYLAGLRHLYPYGDYFAVNVSSPNTPGLRALQSRAQLAELLGSLQAEAARLSRPPKPLLLKVSPDLNERELEDVVVIARQTGIAGLIATNTTTRRDNLRTPAPPADGGVSGKPLRELNTRVVAALYRLSGGAIPIIGVGGIHSGADAYEKVRAGASLVQVYTGLVFEGPRLPGRVVRELGELLRRDGFDHIAAAVGADQPGVRPASGQAGAPAADAGRGEAR